MPQQNVVPKVPIGRGIDHQHRVVAAIYKALLPGLMDLALCALMLVGLVAVAVTEPGIAVTPVRILLSIFLLQQLLGNVRTLQFFMYRRPVQHLTVPVPGAIQAGLAQFGQAGTRTRYPP